jgi:predicted DsbA family dithiol-disulfide isomerase
MDGAAARQLASDIAEGAGKGEEYAGSIANGRARSRVLADIELAMRLGIYATPCFLHRGTLVSGEEDLLETLLAERTGGGEKPAVGSGKP